MIRGWIRVWRKIEDSDILRDAISLQIFIYLLAIVDKTTGDKKIGRFWVSRVLGLNPSTFYKALKRLEEKYKIVTLESNNKYTTVRFINWSKYQGAGRIVPLDGNNKVTTKEQQSNTLQEVKNGELRKGAVLKKLYDPIREFNESLAKDLAEEARMKGGEANE